MLVGALMLFASDRWLWLTSLALVVAYVVFYAASGYPADMTYRLFEYQASWIPVGFVRHLLFEGYYPAIPWLAFLLVGMWIGRLDVRQTAVRRRLLIGGLSIGVLAELASRLLIAVFFANATPDQALVVERAFSRFADLAMPLYILAAGGTAVAVIALCLTLTERHPEARWVRLLAWTGQLALTLYVAHEVIGLGPLVVLGLDNGRSLLFSIGYGTAFFVAAVIFATLWRRRFMRGPLEWVMRRLTA
jgi:uncharacterized protein